MTPLYVLLALVVVGAVAVVAGGRGGGLGDGGSDRPGPWLPVDRPATSADVEAVQFGVGFRGYRMDEVDLVLERLSVELRERDARLSELEARPRTPGAPVPPAARANSAPPESAAVGPSAPPQAPSPVPPTVPEWPVADA